MQTPKLNALRHGFLVACATALWFAGPAEAQTPSPAPQAAAQTDASGNKPNILVIWGDDIGQGNISAFTKA